jgi:hypothetical protein
MNNKGRIVIALRRNLVDELRRLLSAPNAADVRTLQDAAQLLGKSAEPLITLLNQADYQAVSSVVSSRSRSLKAEIASEQADLDIDAPRRGLVGVFTINASALSDAQQRQLVAGLRSLSDLVASAYIETSESVLAGAHHTKPVSFIDKQRFLNAAPEGIGLTELPSNRDTGGRRIGLGAIDHCWNLRHETLAHVDRTLDDNVAQGPIQTSTEVAHGTAALSLILSPPGMPVLGIAPRAVLKVLATPFHADSDLATNAIADAINDAAAMLKRGDVLLLEIEESAHRPVEVNLETWIAIQAATAKGIVVIEPAGNNNWDLEMLAQDPDNAPAWNQHDELGSGIPDSGAIIVSGCTSGPDLHHRSLECNQGERVDSFAQSSGVVSAGAVNQVQSLNDVVNSNQWYRNDFGGTSSASAIVAGVVLLIQEMAIETSGLKRVLRPREIRDVLRNPKVGTPIEFEGKVRYMPDVTKIPSILAEMAASSVTPSLPPLSTGAVIVK